VKTEAERYLKRQMNLKNEQSQKFEKEMEAKLQLLEEENEKLRQ